MSRQRHNTGARPRIAADKAVVAVLRREFAARTPGMPAELRERILAASRPAPRAARRRPQVFFGLGWSGGLLAAGLMMAVGLTLYVQNRGPLAGDPTAVKPPAIPAKPTVWQAASEAAPALLDGRPEAAPAPETNRAVAGLRAKGVGGWLSCSDARWGLADVRPVLTEAGPAAWFVFADGRERIAVLLAPAGPEASGSADQPVVRPGGTGRALVGFRDGEQHLVLAGAEPAARLIAFARTLVLNPVP